MPKSNSHDVSFEEQRQRADRDHELPPADPDDGFEEKDSANVEVEEESQARTTQAAAEAEIKRLREERETLFDQLARKQAEFDNYRKRVARENAEYRDYSVAEAARLLLPVIDNLTLALNHSSGNPEEFRKGVELISRQLQAVLEKMNVQRIPAQGEPFDPRLHEAIEVVETDESPDDHVLEELLPGYRVKDRLLRPAIVKVARAKVG